MQLRVFIVLWVMVLILGFGSVLTYNYLTTPHYGDTEYNGVPIYYIPMNWTDHHDYGWIDKVGIIVCVTGNKTEDQATFYHEIYHVMHPEQKDNDVAAELYASRMVQNYIPKNNT